MRDVIDRFRYRFQLWRRERRDEFSGITRIAPLDENDSLSRFAHPRYATILAESTPRFVVRVLGVYFCFVIILAQMFRIIMRFLPAGRFALGVTFLVLVIFLTPVMLLGVFDLCEARRTHRARKKEII